MKSIITLAFLNITIISYGQEKELTKKSDLQQKNLKGKVKSLKEFNYNATLKNNKIKKKEINFYGENIYSLYNLQGNLTQKYIFFDKDKIKEKYTYVYDKNYNKSEEKFYSYDDNVKANGSYKYNSDGNLLEYYFRYENSDFLDTKTIYQYDKNHNLVELNLYHFDNHLFSNYTYKYDNKHNLIEENKTMGQDHHIKTIYQYNKDNELISSEVSDNYNIFNRKETYQYTKYDQKGNWIERIEYLNGKPYTITEREIEYYE